jgi:hypothetical protein
MGARRIVSEDSLCQLCNAGSGTRTNAEPFLLIVRTGRIVTAQEGRVAPDTRGFQHIAKFVNGTTLVDSYGRRLPGLSFAASPPRRVANNSA